MWGLRWGLTGIPLSCQVGTTCSGRGCQKDHILPSKTTFLRPRPGPSVDRGQARQGNDAKGQAHNEAPESGVPDVADWMGGGSGSMFITMFKSTSCMPKHQSSPIRSNSLV